ncbi:hypothetical protein GCM10009109_04180 [Marinobacterium sediminicola]
MADLSLPCKGKVSLLASDGWRSEGKMRELPDCLKATCGYISTKGKEIQINYLKSK